MRLFIDVGLSCSCQILQILGGTYEIFLFLKDH